MAFMQPLILPWYIIMLISVPQTFLIVKIGFQLFNLHISFPRTLILSLLVSVIVVLARKLPLPYGIHTIIIIISTVLLAVAITNIKWHHCFISITAGTLIVGVLEGVLLPIFLQITVATVDNLASSPWLNIIYFLPLVVIMILFYSLVKWKDYIIFDLNFDRE